MNNIIPCDITIQRLDDKAAEFFLLHADWPRLFVHPKTWLELRRLLFEERVFHTVRKEMNIWVIDMGSGYLVGASKDIPYGEIEVG